MEKYFILSMFSASLADAHESAGILITDSSLQPQWPLKPQHGGTSVPSAPALPLP